MSAWKLLSQERTPTEGSFAAIDALVVTRKAIDLFGENEVERAIVALAKAAIVTKLDRFQVIEHVGTAECLYAVDESGLVTLMLPEDW